MKTVFERMHEPAFQADTLDDLLVIVPENTQPNEYHISIYFNENENYYSDRPRWCLFGECRLNEDIHEWCQERMLTSQGIYVNVLVLDDRIRVFLQYDQIIGSRKIAEIVNKESAVIRELMEKAKQEEAQLEATRAKVKQQQTAKHQAVLDNIAKMTVNGTRLELPENDFFSNYGEVKRVVEQAGGKYKKNGFEFGKDPQPIIDRLLEGEKVNDKKKYQFFETPPELVKRMQELADIQEDDYILEPSAGHGVLVEKYDRKNVDVIELSMENRKVLKEKGFCLCLYDFLDVKPTPKYDKILANPPFTKNQDIKHIKHMYDFLKPGGRIVSMSSNSWRYGTQKLQVEFVDWLSELDHTLHPVPAGAFKSSGTNIATTLIVINK